MNTRPAKLPGEIVKLTWNATKSPDFCDDCRADENRSALVFHEIRPGFSVQHLKKNPDTKGIVQMGLPPASFEAHKPKKHRGEGNMLKRVNP